MRSVAGKIAVSFAMAVMLLGLLGVLAFRNIRQFNSNTQWVIHTHLVIENLQDILLLLTEAETGQRGFIITGNTGYLLSYDAAVTQVAQREQTLRALTHDNPSQQARLKRLTRRIHDTLAELQQTIALSQGAAGLPAARAEVMINRGQDITDDIRATIAEMEEAENRLLVVRTREAQSSEHLTLFVIIIGVPLACLFLTLLAMTLTRGIADPLARLSMATAEIATGAQADVIPPTRRRDEIGVLQRSFREMQARIKERTSALEESNESLRRSEERFRLLVEGVTDYAIILLDPSGDITSWNPGAERMKGWRAEEIIGQPFTRFYPPEDIALGKPELELRQALTAGRFEEEGERVRKDGSRFWASVLITPLYSSDGALFGFAKITRDISERRRAEEELLSLNADLRRQTTELEAAVKEMETFSYSVAHDLRSPLRSLDGFSSYLLEHTAARLDVQEQDYLRRMRAAAQRMAKLIDDLLTLARVGRTEMRREAVNLSAMALEILDELREQDAVRQVITAITPDVIVQGDRDLLRIALAHLLENAWKFTALRGQAQISFGVAVVGEEQVYCVRDNGVGFDMAYVDKLFQPFQRLHTEEEFAGTGIGLALVRRILQRHGGRIWAEAVVGEGATFYFTL